jgi:hypothetical protein
LTAIADEVIEMSGLSFEAARIDNRSEASFGSKPEELSMNKCFPVCSRKLTFDQLVSTRPSY